MHEFCKIAKKFTASGLAGTRHRARLAHQKISSTHFYLYAIAYNMCTRSLIIVATFLLLLIQCASASLVPTTFYISFSKGSDSHDGLTPSTPWQSLERAASTAATLTPGSSLLLRRGDEWQLTTAWFLTGLLGSPTASITIGDYADDASVSRPRIFRPIGSAAGPTLTIDNSSGVSINGLEIVGGEIGIAFTFDIKNGMFYESFTVVDCFFSKIRGLNYNASSGAWWGSAITFASQSGLAQVSDVIISHNMVNDSDTFYKNELPNGGVNWTRCRVVNLLIDSNAITGVSYNTLFLDTTAFVNVTRNVFLRNTPSQLFVAGTTDIIMGTLNESVSITDNEISFRGEYEPGGPDGCAVDFETNATGVTLARNYISRSYGAGIMVFGHVDGSNQNLNIINNTMLYNGCLQSRGDQGGIAFMHRGSSGLISGNTFATCAGTDLFNDKLDPGMVGWILTDNAIDGVNSTMLDIAELPVVTSVVEADGSLLVRASTNSTSGAILRFTLDGSKPMITSQIFPVNGLVFAKDFRATSVFVKAFPTSTTPNTTTTTTTTTIYVESATAGGVFAPT
jgi:hypothetical protein